MPLSAFDVSTARSVTTYRPFVRNRGAGIQLRENVAHDVVRVMRKPLHASARALLSRSITVIVPSPSSHTRMNVTSKSAKAGR